MSGLAYRVLNGLAWASNPVVVVLSTEARDALLAKWRDSLPAGGDRPMPSHISGVPLVFSEMRDSYVMCVGSDGHPVIHML